MSIKKFKMLSYLAAPPHIYDNHNIPQVDYLLFNGHIDPKIDIMTTETLYEDMKRNNFTNFNHKSNQNKLREMDYLSFFNRETLDLMNDFYHKDFIAFNYDIL